MQRRAKIAATLGPACDDERVLARMIDAGLDVARLNFSHGSIDVQGPRIERLRRVALAREERVAVLADLQGPRLRVGVFDGGEMKLVKGRSVELVPGKDRAGEGQVPVRYAGLCDEIRAGDPILMDDGKLELRAERKRRGVLTCRVVRGGVLRDRKGMNLPKTELSVPTISKKDRADLRGAVEAGADWLAVSFVRRGRDLDQARRLLKRAGSDMPILAKIESAEAIERLDEILDASDGLLVARGDLGVELPPSNVPILQKRIIEKANAAGKPVMTATQMLESMRHSSRPTRAEASDVANAVLDGSGCLLLTAETAAGDYPVEAVRMMDEIIRQAEAADRTYRAELPDGPWSAALTTCRAGTRAAERVGARCLVVFTQSGFSALQTSRFRPATRLLAFTPEEKVARRLKLVWGVEPRSIEEARSIDAMIEEVDRAMLEKKLARRGDLVVLLAGAPLGVPGTTNFMVVHPVGGGFDLVRRR